MTVACLSLMETLHGGNLFDYFIRTRDLDLQGRNSTTPVLAELVHELQPRVIIDVGVWKGGSTIHFAELLRESGVDGVVVAVDTFLGSVEHWDETRENRLRWRWRHSLYDQFLSNVVLSRLQGYIVPMPQTSANAAAILKKCDVKADLVHIDASHDYDSVLQDARAYWDLLTPGGALVGDDYSPTWPGVVDAANQFAAEVGCALVDRNPKWIVRKPA